MQTQTSIGRRKTSSAKIKMVLGSGVYLINSKDIDTYFGNDSKLKAIALKPLKNFGLQNKYDLIIDVRGGGLNSQAGAIQLSVSKILAQISNSYKTSLKKIKLLTQDRRQKERRKYGLKKARKAPQYSKR